MGLTGAVSQEPSDQVVGTTADGYVIDDGNSLRWRLNRKRLRKARTLWMALSAVWLVLVAAAVIRGEFASLIGVVPWMLLMWWQFRRIRRASVGTDGIRPPGASKVTPWTDIEHVQTPGRFVSTTAVGLTDQSVFDTGFPASCADRIAAIGGKPMVRSPRAKPTPAPAHRRRREPTIEERAQALRERNAQLLRDVRPHNDEPPPPEAQRQ